MLPGSQEPPIEEYSRGYGYARRSIQGSSGSICSVLSRPLGVVWGRAADLRLRKLDQPGVASILSCPTISVGNVTVGGGGKTSLVKWLVSEGLPAGIVPTILTRGYGRRGSGVQVLSPAAPLEKASTAGDEPLLLARAGAWVGVGTDRAEAARAVAEQVHPGCFILDDGLQHRRVARDVDLVTFTVEDLARPARCLPAGPLRQNPHWRPPAVVWVVVGSDPREQKWPSGSIGSAYREWWRDLPGTTASWVDAGTVELSAWRRGLEDPMTIPEGPLVGIAGVADPASIGRFAGQVGMSLRSVAAFPDHHIYRPHDVERVLDRHPAASFVTTEKDAVKLEPEWFRGRQVGVLRRHLEPHAPDVVRRAVAATFDSGDRESSS